jgi:cytochrome b
MHQVGHNPLGALSVFAMLFFLLAQVVSGLMSDDEIASVGPLVPFVSSTWVNYATYYHKEIGKVALLVLVVSHLCAIAFYYFRSHENLVRPMVTGDKLLSFAALSASDTIADRIRAGVIFVGCTALVSSAVTWLG